MKSFRISRFEIVIYLLTLPVSGLAQASATKSSQTTIVAHTKLLTINGPDLGAESESGLKITVNEAAVIDVCRQYIDAQFQYFRSERDSGGFLEFAQKIRSSPGQRDGLYWPLDDSEDESPVGPRLAAAAVAEKHSDGEAQPVFGYYLKILLSQGPAAPGGARDYRIDGRLIGGFALIVWPAEYGVSGVHSFQVNQLGDVYAKDLGHGTEQSVAATSTFSPDRTWIKVASFDPH